MRCPSPPLPPVTRATAPLRSISFLLYAGPRLSCRASPRPPAVCYLARRAGKLSVDPRRRRGGRTIRLFVHGRLHRGERHRYTELLILGRSCGRPPPKGAHL